MFQFEQILAQVSRKSVLFLFPSTKMLHKFDKVDNSWNVDLQSQQYWLSVSRIEKNTSKIDNLLFDLSWYNRENIEFTLIDKNRI